MTAVYVTGGGKCGTHLVAAYLAANWPGSTAHPHEFNDWRSRLTEVAVDRFVFHCPDPDISLFHRLCPDGKAIILLRHPAQQYVSWLVSLSYRAVIHKSFVDPKLGNLLSLAAERTICGYRDAPLAAAVWRIEDFTADAETRAAMGRSLIPDFRGVDLPPGAVQRSNRPRHSGIEPVRFDEYPAILTDGEIRLFDEAHVEKYYPGWKDDLLMLDRSNDQRLRQRTEYLVRWGKRLILRNHLRRGMRPPVVMLYPTALLAARMMRGASEAPGAPSSVSTKSARRSA